MAKKSTKKRACAKPAEPALPSDAEVRAVCEQVAQGPERQAKLCLLGERLRALPGGGEFGEAVAVERNRQEKVGTYLVRSLRSAPAQAVPADRAAKKSVEEVRNRLLGMVSERDRYTSDRDLGRKIGCSEHTVAKAVERTPLLQKWKCGGRPDRKARLRAGPLNEVMLERVGDSTAEPAKLAEEADELRADEAALAKLLGEVGPTDRAKINAMPEEDRLALARLSREQKIDAKRGKKFLPREV